MAQNANTDIGLNANYTDIMLKNFDLFLTEDVAATLQRVHVKLRLFFGEWFLDPEFGIDYYGEMLVKNPDLLAIEALLFEQLTDIPLVENLNGLEFDYVTTDKTLTISMDIQVDGTSQLTTIEIAA